MKDVILVFEEIPENVYIYDLMVDDDVYNKLLNCHLKYINGNMEEDLSTWLCDFIYDKETGKKHLMNIGEGPVLNRKFDALVVTGFIL